MKISIFTFTDSKNYTIYAYKYLPETTPKAVIQIAHGMAEYSQRYEGFAKALTENGYAVFINDMIGHGKSVNNQGELGHFPKGGFEAAIEDLHRITKQIKSEYPNIPVILMGHSMGSFLTQAYICKYGNDINGCILSGTAGKNPAAGFGAFVAKLLTLIYGEKHKSKLLDNLSFGKYNNSFKPNRTSFDWLSRNEEEVDKYVASPLCGFLCTNMFYNELLGGLKNLYNLSYMENIPKELPIYIIGGEKDPVGNNTKTVLQLIDIYKKLNIKDVQYKFYKDGRHEMLNETNKDEVYSDILNWINKITENQ